MKTRKFMKTRKLAVLLTIASIFLVGIVGIQPASATHARTISIKITAIGLIDDRDAGLLGGADVYYQMSGAGATGVIGHYNGKAQYVTPGYPDGPGQYYNTPDRTFERTYTGTNGFTLYMYDDDWPDGDDLLLEIGITISSTSSTGTWSGSTAKQFYSVNPFPYVNFKTEYTRTGSGTHTACNPTCGNSYIWTQWNAFYITVTIS